MNDTTQNQESGVDKDALNLTHAIALQESGSGGIPNYDAVGDNGTSHGAYQWQPGNFQSEANDAGLDPDDFSPKNQDKVAYARVEKLKKQGYTPGQIAAGHNAGMGKVIDGSWENNKGTTEINGKPVSYDTPAYVKGVQSHYNQLSGQASQPQIPTATPTTPTTKPGMPSWEKWLLGGLGVAGAVGLTAATGGLDLLGLGAGAAAEGAADVAGAAEAGEAGSGILAGLKTATAPVAGAVEGYEAVKGALGTPQASTQPLQQQTQPLNDQTYSESNGASNELAIAQKAAVSQTPTGRVFLQSPEAQQGINSNAKYGILPEVDNNGNYDSSNSLKKSESMIGELSDGIAKSLDAEGTHANIKDAVEEAKANMRQYTPSNDWDDAEKHIEDQAKSYQRFADDNGNISLGNLERMKKEQYRASGRWDIQTTSSKRAAHKALAVGARRTIAKNTEAKELYNLAMKEEQGLINGKKVLKRLNGKKAHKDTSAIKSISEKLSQYAAIAIGDKVGGPLGAILGAVVGESLQKKIDKKFGKTALEKPSTQKALKLLEEKKPEVAKLIQEAIQKYTSRKGEEQELKVIEKIPEKKIIQDEKEMGTYKLGKNKTTGRVELKSTPVGTPKRKQ